MDYFQEQGKRAYKRGDFKAAIAAFDRAIHRAPSVQLFDLRAACNEKLGDLSTALKDAKGAIRLRTEDPTGYLRAGKLLVKMNKLTLALDLYGHGLKNVRHVGRGYQKLCESYRELSERLTPPKYADPLFVLPRELVEMIFDHLSFRQRVAARRVSTSWMTFIDETPNCWRHLDLSNARKPVKNAFLSRAIHSGKGRLTVATLANVARLDKALPALVKHCPLEELSLHNNDMCGANIEVHLSGAKHLKTLRLTEGVRLSGSNLAPLMRALSGTLESLECDFGDSAVLSKLTDVSCDKLKSLSVRAKMTKDIDAILADVSQRMPSLEHLILQPCLLLVEVDVFRRVDLRRNTKLQHLSMQNFLLNGYFLEIPPSVRTLDFSDSIMHLHDPIYTTASATLSLPILESLSISLGRLDKNYQLDYFLSLRPGSERPDLEPSKLRKFSISVIRCPGIAALLLFLSNPRLAELEHFGVSGPSELKDSDFVQIAHALPMLKSLDVSQSDITGVGVKEIVCGGCLEELVVNDCRHLGVDAVDWARSKGIRVEYRMVHAGTGGKKVRY